MTPGRFRWVVLLAVCLALTLAVREPPRDLAERLFSSGRWRPVSHGSPPAVVMVSVEIFENGKEPQHREVPVPPP